MKSRTTKVDTESEKYKRDLQQAMSSLSSEKWPENIKSEAYLLSCQMAELSTQIKQHQIFLSSQQTYLTDLAENIKQKDTRGLLARIFNW